MEVRIAPDRAGLAHLAAGTITRWLAGGGTLGLAGGGTPMPTYQALQALPVPWREVTLWLTDERWVPTHHADSNTAMAAAALADHVPARLLEVPEIGEGDPQTAAGHYDAMLATHVAAPDVVLLGVGSDGHTASLFPDTPALQATEGRFMANYVTAKDTWRLTATVPYLQSAAQVGFIVSGKSKAPVVAELLGGGSSLPAARVAEGAAAVTWFLDGAAAASLP